MNKLLLCLALFLTGFIFGQIDEELNSISLADLPHFTERIIQVDEIEIDDLEQVGDSKVLLHKALYIQKFQGIWMYDSDSCAIKRIKARKMAYFPSGTKAIYLGLSIDVGLKKRKFLRGVSYQITEDLAIGDTLICSLTTLADAGSQFNPKLYTSKKLKSRSGKLKNGNYLHDEGYLPIPSVNDQELIINHLKIPITDENQDMQWLHVINNEDTQDKGFIIQAGATTKGTMDDEFERVFFRINSYQLGQQSKKTLDAILKTLSSSSSIVLRGYADPSGQKEYNMELAKKRAEAVMDYFIEHGIDAERVKIEDFDIGVNKLAKDNRICTILVL